MVQFELRQTEWDSYNWGILVKGHAADGWAGRITDGENEWPFSGTVWAFFDLYEACVCETEAPDNQQYPNGYFTITEQGKGILLEHTLFGDLQIETTYRELRVELERLFKNLFALMDANTIPPGRKDAITLVDETYDFDAQQLYATLITEN